MVVLDLKTIVVGPHNYSFRPENCSFEPAMVVLDLNTIVLDLKTIVLDIQTEVWDSGPPREEAYRRGTPHSGTPRFCKAIGT